MERLHKNKRELEAMTAKFEEDRERLKRLPAKKRLKREEEEGMTAKEVKEAINRLKEVIEVLEALVARREAAAAPEVTTEAAMTEAASEAAMASPEVEHDLFSELSAHLADAPPAGAEGSYTVVPAGAAPPSDASAPGEGVPVDDRVEARGATRRDRLTITPHFGTPTAYGRRVGPTSAAAWAATDGGDDDADDADAAAAAPALLSEDQIQEISTQSRR